MIQTVRQLTFNSAPNFNTLPLNSRVDCFVLLTTLKPPVADIFDTAVNEGLGTVVETHIFAEVEAGVGPLTSVSGTTTSYTLSPHFPWGGKHLLSTTLTLRLLPFSEVKHNPVAFAQRTFKLLKAKLQSSSSSTSISLSPPHLTVT